MTKKKAPSKSEKPVKKIVSKPLPKVDKTKIEKFRDGGVIKIK